MPLSPMSVTRLQRMLLQNPGSLAAFDRVFSWEVHILTVRLLYADSIESHGRFIV